MRRRYGLNLRMMTVAHHDEELWKVDPENCCSAVKVGQLDRALAGKAAWMSGLRRDEASTRAGAPIVTRDLRGLVKVNPIATWSDLDVQGYIADHDVPVNPLLHQGYTSIGCQPCTALPTDAGDPARAAGPAGARRSAASTSEPWRAGSVGPPALRGAYAGSSPSPYSLRRNPMIRFTVSISSSSLASSPPPS